MRVCLGQIAIEEKSNEITVVSMLLELLNIEGAVVTFDAMNCQMKTVTKICVRRADYLITVKKNQATFFIRSRVRQSSGQEIMSNLMLRPNLI